MTDKQIKEIVSDKAEAYIKNNNLSDIEIKLLEGYVNKKVKLLKKK